MREPMPAIAQSALLDRAQFYLTHPDKDRRRAHDLETAWIVFYELYSRKIQKYAFACGATEQDIADCVQDVWSELLVRLPSFRLDPEHGKFDTWLFHIVRGKTVDLLRARKRRISQDNSDALQTVADHGPGPVQALEDEETVRLAWEHLRTNMSKVNIQVLQLRLVEQRPVAEVAEELGISNQQVWYRYHRARRELLQLGSALERGPHFPRPCGDLLDEKTKKTEESAQGKAATFVSRSVGPSSLSRQGGHCVDYVFQRLELGRRELNPEWKVEWNCDAEPKPVLYIRKMAIVAYAEMCGPGEYMNSQWPRIVNAAIAAGVAAGIATIIATPTAALPVFQAEFLKQMHGKVSGSVDEKLRVALSAKQEANGPWCVCNG